MPVPQVLVAKFFQLLAQKQLTEAEHEFEIIKLDMHFVISGRDLETIGQFLVHRQFTEAARDLAKLEQLLTDKQFAIVQHEWEKIERNLSSKQFAEVKSNLEITRQFLVDRKFTEAIRELDKVMKVLDEKGFIEAKDKLEKCRRILANKHFSEAVREVSMLKKLVENGEFTKAERELEKLKHRRTEWNRGYFRALSGMVLARRSNNNDSYAFFSKLDLNDKTVMSSYKREFSEHVKNRLHGDFDRGFFSAWADCMRVLNKLDLSNVPTANGSTISDKKPETIQPEKSQATIQDFLSDEEED